MKARMGVGATLDVHPSDYLFHLRLSNKLPGAILSMYFMSTR